MIFHAHKTLIRVSLLLQQLTIGDSVVNNHKLEHERKFNAIVDRLKMRGHFEGQVYMTYQTPLTPDETRHRIDRQSLKILIIQAIGDSNRHTLSKWINELLALKIIELNPDSQKWNNGSIIMPHDSTKYFLNFDNELFDRHTLPNYRSGNDNDHQAANKVNSSSL
jgi:hypothetical protein